LIPKVAKSGHSFKGAAAYYLHDKTEDNAFNQASGAKSKTSERVDWTETRNLPTDNPNLAWKMMAASANDGDYLKAKHREAQGKRPQASGETNGKAVYAYSLGWHPDEKDNLSREDMNAAVDATLKKLGFDNHQALVVSHNDTAHPHVHVLVNKVNQQTGKMHNPHMDYKSLDKWAREYRKERGQEHYCENREKKWQNHDKGVSNENRQKQTNARLDSDQHKAMSADNPQSQKVRKDQARMGDRISNFAKAQKARHSDEWDQFKAGNKQAKDAIYSKYSPMMNGAKDDLTAAKYARSAVYDKFKEISAKKVQQIKNAYRPQLSMLGKKQWFEKRRWEEREKTLAGRVINSISAARFLSKHSPTSQGFLKDLKMMHRNKAHRAAAIISVHKVEFDKLCSKMQRDISAVKKQVNNVRGEELKPAQAAHKKARENISNIHNHRKGELSYLEVSTGVKYTDLKHKQAAERKRVQTAWGKLKARRAKALKRIKNRVESKARINTATAQAFKEANKTEAEKEVKKKTRNRNRSKDRKRSRGRTQRYDL